MTSPADHSARLFRNRRLRRVGIALGVLAILLIGIILLSPAFLTSGPCGSDRGEAEIAALSAALESYKADKGHYPSNADTDRLRPDVNFDPADYISSSKLLYRSLAGAQEGTVYFEFNKNMLKQDAAGETYLIDPKGHSYGYSTAGAKNGTNFFDLWSTAGGTTSGKTNQWIRNW